MRINDGRQVNAETLVWTAGVRPSPLIRPIEVWRPEGTDHRIPVNEYPQLRGYKTLWAIGDCALVPGRRRRLSAAHGAACGSSGQAFGSQPRGVPHGPKAGALPLPWHWYAGDSGARHRDVGRVLGVRLTGFLAWFAWRTYYLFALPGRQRRLRVAFDWTLDLLFPPDIVELKVEPLQTGQEALTAGSAPAQKPVAKEEASSFH